MFREECPGNVFPGLKAGAFRQVEDNVLPREQDISSGIDVAVVDRSAVLAHPFPYCETLQPSRAAEASALGTGLRRKSLVSLYVGHAVPVGFVAEHPTEHRPASVEHALCERSPGETGGVHVADNDSGEAIDQSPRGDMQVVLPSIGNLGVDRLRSLLVTSPLRDGECGFLATVVSGVLDRLAVGHRGERLQPEVDADTFASARGSGLDFALQVQVPPTARIFTERPREHAALDWAMHPESVASPEVGHAALVEMDGTRGLEGNPAERTLRPLRGAPSWPTALRVARASEVPGDVLHGVGVQFEQSRRSSGELAEVKAAGPASRPASCLILHVAAVVPDEVDGARFRGEHTGLLDTVAKRKYHDRPRVLGLCGRVKSYALGDTSSINCTSIWPVRKYVDP